MKSLDTNVLLYATNRDCAEHAAARSLVERAVSERNGWIVADQVYFELYRLLRNPSVLRSPLSAPEAASTVRWYRERSGWLRCAWEIDFMPVVMEALADDSFPARKTFDLVLGATLQAHGVTEFYTRNVADFGGIPGLTVVNPIDSR